MRTPVGEVAVGIALIEQPRESVSQHANIVRNMLRPLIYELEELHKCIIDRSQDAPFQRLSRPPLHQVPTHRQPIGELALGLLVAAFAAPANGPNIERTAATARSGRSVHTVPAFRFPGLFKERALSELPHRAYGP